MVAQYGQDLLCITTRQCLQFHWIRQQDIYKIQEGMQEVGVLTHNACGDVTRNVVACPMQGVCPHEIGDSGRMLTALADDSELLHEQRNLPRKLKISVAGCGRSCGQTLMNCQGWHPVERNGANGPEIGWKFHAGGGLGARPRLAKATFDWVPEDLVPDVARATVEAFRRHGDRRKRAFARLKFVVERKGLDGFRRILLGILEERGVGGLGRLEFSAGPADVAPSFLDGQGVIPQKQAGFNTVRIVIPRSEFTSAEARRFAAWAREFGDGSLTFSARQNLLLHSVPDAKVDELVGQLEAAGYDLEAHERVPGAVACVGTTMCNLAVADTPNTYHRIVAELGQDREWWKRIGTVLINMNGCPNSCGQHIIVDIGLRGARLTEAEGSDEGYSVFVGGSLAGAGHLGEYVCDVAANDVTRLLKRMLDAYLAERHSDDERFGAFARRIGGAGVAKLIASPPAERQPANLRNLSLAGVFDQVVSENRQG